MSNIIIAGGGLINKGAQAMTLISICELKKRYPEHQIYLLTWNASQNEKVRHAPYDLELLQIPPKKFASAAKNPLKRAVYFLHYRKNFTEIDQIYRDTELLIDISGYAIGSNWSEKVCNDYLDNIEFALAYDIPVYLLPQSFGPFDFQDEAGQQIDHRIRKIFPQVKLICAREAEGYSALLAHYKLEHNTILTEDMVLSSRIHDYSVAMKQKPDIVLPEITEDCMCLIPNVRACETNREKTEELYHCAVRKGIACGLTVYITYHSTQDAELCQKLKSDFSDEAKVVLLDHDYSCMEFNELVKKFRFVVCSRFHALVHALKNGVPCVAMGWAIKYVDLMKLFGQNAYMLDLRESVSLDAVQEAVGMMAERFTVEAETIRERLPDVQRENVFDKIKKLD